MRRLTSRSKSEAKDKYGLTARQRELMWERQGGKCPICGRALWKRGNKEGRRASPIDHSHRAPDKGRVRGYLDYRCNRFYVGRHTLETARAVVRYLESEFDGRQL